MFKKTFFWELFQRKQLLRIHSLNDFKPFCIPLITVIFLLLNLSFSFSVPSVAPPSVEAHAMNAHQIIVTWKPIPQHSTNGVLIGYKVRFTDTKTPSIHGEMVVDRLLQASLTGLKAHTRYLIQVSGYTNAGQGVASTAKFTLTDEARK